MIDKCDSGQALKDALISVIERGDPDYDNTRTENVVGVSDCRVCPLKRELSILVPLEKRPFSMSLLIGNAFHNYIEMLVRKKFAGVATEELVWTEIQNGGGIKNVASRVDILARNIKADKNIIIDLKTTSKSIESWKENIEDYIEQLNWYLGVKNAEKGYLVAFSYANPFAPLKDCIGVVEINFSRTLFKQTYERFLVLFESLENKTLAPAVLDTVHCAFCPYKLYCEKFVFEFLKPFSEKNNGIYAKTETDGGDVYVLTQLIMENPQYFERENCRLIKYKIKLTEILKQYHENRKVLMNTLSGIKSNGGVPDVK